MARIRRRSELADSKYEKWELKQKNDASERRYYSVSERAAQSRRFLRSSEWKTAREICFSEKGMSCWQCGATEQIQVDHIKPRVKYPDLALVQSNLRPLCWNCNRTKAAKDVADEAGS